MKKTTILLCTVLMAHLAMAQVVNNPFPKTITVSGSADLEIVPDEIYVNVDLQEYLKKGEPKKDIETIKTQFLEACKAIGIADTNISIVSYSGYNNYYFIKKKKKAPDMLATITYQVKFKSSQLMDELVGKLDDEATRNFEIVSVSHSRMTEFRKELKIKAIQAARFKGQYLTDAISEKLGEAITITEPDEPATTENNNNTRYSQYSLSNTSSNMRMDNLPETRLPEIDFKKIKLRYEVNVVFALK